MKTMNSFLLLVLALTASAIAVADDAGSVIFVKGDVSAERQPPVALAKGDAVLDDDEIVTGSSSRAQLLMIDGAKIAIRPDSRLRIEEYAYTPAASGVAVSANDDKTVMNLVKGGFRTITGAIGKEADDEYEVRTAVGVLGIRGTDYTAVFCNGDCTWVPGVPAASTIADGLYLGVTDGTIVFRTSLSTIEVTAGQYVFIPLDSPEPQRLDSAPSVLLDDNDLRFDDNQGGTSGKPGRSSETTGFNATLGTRRAPDSSTQQSGDTPPADSDNSAESPQQPTIATDPDGSVIDITPGTQPDPQNPRTLSYSGSPLGATDVARNAVLDNPPGVYVLDVANNPTGFDSLVTGRTGGDVVSFEIGTASNVDTGFDSMTILRWGRWSGGSMTATQQSTGIGESIDLTNESLHWISGPAVAPPTMPITGVATYTLIGGTSPTDNFGNTGVLGDATFLANFTSMSVDSTIQLDIAGSSWSAAGTGTIGAQLGLPPHQFQGFYNTLVIDGVTGGSGDFSGFFSEPGATSDPAFPGGVGLNYSLQDPQGGTTVNGAVTFGNP